MFKEGSAKQAKQQRFGKALPWNPVGYQALISTVTMNYAPTPPKKKRAFKTPTN